MEIMQNIWMALTTENLVLINIQGVLFSFVEIYFSMLIFTTLFNVNSTTKSKLIYIISFSILSSLSRFFISDPYGTFLNLIICPSLIILIFKTNILKSIFSEIIPILIFAIIDSILMKAFHLFNISTNEILAIPVYRMMTSLIEYIFMYLIYLLIKYSKFTITSLDTKNKKQNTILVVTTIFGVIAIFTQMYISCYYINFLPISIIIISISSLIAYFAVSIYSLVSTSKLNIAKQNLEETRLMNKTLAILNDKIRAFRHDFNNIIQALGGYVQAKDLEGLEKYYSQLLKDCQEVNNLTGLNPDAINNPAIYSLISSKYYLATEQGIEFNLDIFMDLNSIDMKIYEFCRILGILLDNAIQATQECDERIITVTIRKDTRCKRQLLIIENTYKDKEIDTEKIYEKGYSTKEGNTGLGLWEVRQILTKNTNLNLFTSKDETYFKQQLEIYRN